MWRRRDKCNVDITHQVRDRRNMETGHLQEITSKDMELVMSDEEDVWTLGNEVLYQLCRNYPEHNRPDVVVAKVWLIGRSYAAAIERRRQVDRGNPIASDAFYEDKVAPILISSDIDDQLNSLQQCSEINDQSVSAILSVHKYLVDIFEELTGQRKRSLASKYLHFHRPNLFYIYDTRAETGLKSGRRRLKLQHKASRTAEGSFDILYAHFALRLLDLQEEIERRFGERLTPRQIDRLLLKLAASHKKA